MKTLFALLALALSSFTPAFASEEDGDLSPAEIKLCRTNGCIGQSVSTGAHITSIGKEDIYVENKTQNKYVQISVVREEPEFTIEYTILQWIGHKDYLDQEKLDNARAFAAKLEEMRKAGKPVNLVVQGSANQMTAEFPLLGFFTHEGEFFFLNRIVAPLLTHL